MGGNTRALSLTALYTTGAVVVLYLGMLFPAMSLSFAALAGLFTAAAVIEGGFSYGALCFIAAGILGLVLLPLRTGPILYATFFGAYPLIKSFAERQQGRILGWGIKFAAFFIVLTLYLTVLRALVAGAIPFADWAFYLIYLAGAIAFLVYDIGISKLIGFYLARIYKYRDGW